MANDTRWFREITVDSVRQRNLYYWMIASERDAARDPVVLWLTGGPGCSSLDALIYENGPFRLHFADGASLPRVHTTRLLARPHFRQGSMQIPLPLADPPDTQSC